MHFQAVEESGLGYWAQKETCTMGAYRKSVNKLILYEQIVCDQSGLVLKHLMTE